MRKDKYMGIRTIISPEKTAKEIHEDELDKFYEDNIKNRKIPSTNEHLGDTTEHISDYLPTISLATPSVSPVVKPKVYRSFDKDNPSHQRVVHKYITRPPATEDQKQHKEFWNADNDKTGKLMLKYVNDYGDNPVKYDKDGYPDKASDKQMEGLKDRQENSRNYGYDPNRDAFKKMAQDEADSINVIKKMAWEKSAVKSPRPNVVTAQDVMSVYQKEKPLPPKKLHQKLEAQGKVNDEKNYRVVKQLEALNKWSKQGKEEQHPAEQHYTDRIQEIDQKEKSWLAKRLKNQNQKEAQDRKPESRNTETANKEGNKSG